MTQAARSARTLAAAALKESVRVLTKYKNTENPNKRLLHQKLDKALADWQEPYMPAVCLCVTEIQRLVLK